MRQSIGLFWDRVGVISRYQGTEQGETEMAVCGATAPGR